jgi:hypothetical protein
LKKRVISIFLVVVISLSAMAPIAYAWSHHSHCTAHSRENAGTFWETRPFPGHCPGNACFHVRDGTGRYEICRNNGVLLKKELVITWGAWILFCTK